jgi:predicted nucleic acid-binding protein
LAFAGGSIRFRYDELSRKAAQGFEDLPDNFSPSTGRNRTALDWAERAGQAKAYDAQYLALAEEMRAEFWTADERLVRDVQQAGADWAHWIGEI